MGGYLIITLAIFAALIVGGILLFWKGVSFFKNWKPQSEVPEEGKENSPSNGTS